MKKRESCFAAEGRKYKHPVYPDGTNAPEERKRKPNVRPGPQSPRVLMEHLRNIDSPYIRIKATSPSGRKYLIDIQESDVNQDW